MGTPDVDHIVFTLEGQPKVPPALDAVSDRMILECLVATVALGHAKVPRGMFDLLERTTARDCGLRTARDCGLRTARDCGLRTARDCGLDPAKRTDPRTSADWDNAIAAFYGGELNPSSAFPAEVLRRRVHIYVHEGDRPGRVTVEAPRGVTVRTVP